VPPRDGLALVEALRRLRNDPVLRDSMGLAGSDRARTRYSWPRIAAETRRIYAAVAQRTSTEAVVR
jgi:glycosyltransferase involved in cell wall biosynthesis